MRRLRPPFATTSQAGAQSGGCSSAGSPWIALGALVAARLARRRKEGRAPAA
ncbi:MAG: Synerg-CTERM sorting domain-containing protein [Myxococcales bacterium]